MISRQAPLSITSLALASLLTIGCGGDSSAPRATPGPSPGPSSDPFACDAAEGLILETLENFESGEASAFYTNADSSEGSSVVPPKGSQSPPSEDIIGGRCGLSARAFKMTGTGLSDWGMVFGLNFPGGPQNLEDYEGISFWARRGEESGASLFFSVFDPQTDPSGGTCASDPKDQTEKCDSYGAGAGLEERWRFYKMPFNELRQRGFGVPTKSLDTSRIIGINWAMEPGDWEVWVDDVSFYKEPTSDDRGGAAGSTAL